LQKRSPGVHPWDRNIVDRIASTPRGCESRCALFGELFRLGASILLCACVCGYLVLARSSASVCRPGEGGTTCPKDAARKTHNQRRTENGANVHVRFRMACNQQRFPVKTSRCFVCSGNVTFRIPGAIRESANVHSGRSPRGSTSYGMVIPVRGDGSLELPLTGQCHHHSFEQRVGTGRQTPIIVVGRNPPERV